MTRHPLRGGGDQEADQIPRDQILRMGVVWVLLNGLSRILVEIGPCGDGREGSKVLAGKRAQGLVISVRARAELWSQTVRRAWQFLSSQGPSLLLSFCSLILGARLPFSDLFYDLRGHWSSSHLGHSVGRELGMRQGQWGTPKLPVP